MLEERHRRGPRHGDLSDCDGRREREAEQNPGRDRAGVAPGHGPTPAAGAMTSTVWATFSALRRVTAAFATARAARRRLFSTMLAGTSRSWRAFRNTVTPAIPPGPPTGTATGPPPRPRSAFAATLATASAPRAAPHAL